MEIDQEYIDIFRKAIMQIIEEISNFVQEAWEIIRKENRTRLQRPPKKIEPRTQAPVYKIRAHARSHC